MGNVTLSVVEGCHEARFGFAHLDPLTMTISPTKIKIASKSISQYIHHTLSCLLFCK